MKIVSSFAAYSAWVLALTENVAMEMPHLKYALFFVLVLMLAFGFSLAQSAQAREGLGMKS